MFFKSDSAGSEVLALESSEPPVVARSDGHSCIDALPEGIVQFENPAAVQGSD